MSSCAVCGRGVRKTSLALVPSEDGIKARRVCSTCLGRALVIVPIAPAVRCSCGELATACQRCVEKAADKSKRGAASAIELAANLRKRARAYADDYSERDYRAGLAAGLDQAADYLEKGSW